MQFDSQQAVGGAVMPVTFFRQRRAGPEIAVEDAVASQIPDLFGSDDYPLWAGGSMPIGAGRPDLVVVSCAPEVYALAQVELSTSQVLAYLRAVGRARLETIVERTGKPRQIVLRCIEGLQELSAVSGASEVYCLRSNWRNILPEIVTIEVKVANWRKAISQAARNRVFAHKSFVALPDSVARRVCSARALSRLGIGVLSVAENGEVGVAREARHRQPRVWTYYYQLARTVAVHSGEGARCHS